MGSAVKIRRMLLDVGKAIQLPEIVDIATDAVLVAQR